MDNLSTNKIHQCGSARKPLLARSQMMPSNKINIRGGVAEQPIQPSDPTQDQASTDNETVVEGAQLPDKSQIYEAANNGNNQNNGIIGSVTIPLNCKIQPDAIKIQVNSSGHRRHRHKNPVNQKSDAENILKQEQEQKQEEESGSASLKNQQNGGNSDERAKQVNYLKQIFPGRTLGEIKGSISDNIFSQLDENLQVTIKKNPNMKIQDLQQGGYVTIPATSNRLKVYANGRVEMTGGKKKEVKITSKSGGGDGDDQDEYEDPDEEDQDDQDNRNDQHDNKNNSGQQLDEDNSQKNNAKKKEQERQLDENDYDQKEQRQRLEQKGGDNKKTKTGGFFDLLDQEGGRKTKVIQKTSPWGRKKTTTVKTRGHGHNDTNVMVTSPPVSPPSTSVVTSSGGGGSYHDPLFDIAFLADLYDSTNIDAFLIMPKWSLGCTKKFVERRLNKYAFALIVMMAYRLPTYPGIIEKFAGIFRIRDVNCPHWLEIRSNNTVLAEYAYPFNSLYVLQRTINCVEKNLYVDAMMANYAIENISNKVKMNDPNASLLTKLSRVYYKAEKFVTQDKVMGEFEQNMKKLNSSQDELLEELSKIQTLLTGVFDDDIIYAVYGHLENLSRPAYNEMLLQGMKHADY
jgi:hypothetical protein